MRRAAAIASLLVLCACSRQSVQVIAPKDLPPEIYRESASVEEASAPLVIYLVGGNRLVRVGRTGSAVGSDVEAVVRELLAGPTAEEVATGIETNIPSSVELHGVRLEGGVAFVDFDRSFFVYEAEEDRDPYEFILRTAQLVWTLDELPNVNAVRILFDGQEVPLWDQDRRVIREPVARTRYRAFAPKSERVVNEAPLQID